MSNTTNADGKNLFDEVDVDKNSQSTERSSVTSLYEIARQRIEEYRNGLIVASRGLHDLYLSMLEGGFTQNQANQIIGHYLASLDAKKED